MDYEFNFQLEIRAPYLLAGLSNFSYDNFLKVLTSVCSKKLHIIITAVKCEKRGFAEI